MFGLKKERTFEDYRANVLPGAIADIPRQREEEAKLLVQYQNDLKRDADAYKIRVEKFGTALALFIEGHVNWNDAVEKVCHTINLIASPNIISLKEGHAPDLNGTKWCHVTGDENSPKYSWSEHHGWFPNGAGGDYFLQFDPKPSNDRFISTWGGTTYSGDIKHSIDGCSRPAKSDRIRFEGAGATLIVPFGLGHQVYRQILTALGNAHG